jgi:uncharacterized integral membrane protein (TIGR00698 family)
MTATAATADSLSRRTRLRVASLVPGVAASIMVGAASVGIGALEDGAFGRAIVEPLVVAILVGMCVRAVRGEPTRETSGVRFVAKDVLEFAVFLLGATMDVPRLFASGPALAAGIAILVCVALGIGYGIGRAVGLPARLAFLVACGNAICGNSAIAAVAPVIGADREDVAASIALTAVLGVGVVLTLPLLIIPLGYSHYQYGVLAGLTVYAVPQVLAAAFAVSPLSGQVATAVKLARVLMLGPVVLGCSLVMRRAHRASRIADDDARWQRGSRPAILPWFVVGFVVLAALRSFGAIPDVASFVAKSTATWLTIAAMAALGLSVDLRSVRRVGVRVVVAVAGSLGALVAIAVSMIRILSIT